MPDGKNRNQENWKQVGANLTSPKLAEAKVPGQKSAEKGVSDSARHRIHGRYRVASGRSHLRQKIFKFFAERSAQNVLASMLIIVCMLLGAAALLQAVFFPVGEDKSQESHP